MPVAHKRAFPNRVAAATTSPIILSNYPYRGIGQIIILGSTTHFLELRIESSGETLREINKTTNVVSRFRFTLMKTKIPSFLVMLLIACLGASQNAQAVTPAPDGGYPGGNTAEGQDALLNLRSNGTYNTAVGWLTLNSNTRGSFNTAIGADALQLNNDAGENTAIGAGTLPVNDNLGLSGGHHNTAVGAFALFNNTNGAFST